MDCVVVEMLVGGSGGPGGTCWTKKTVLLLFLRRL